MASSSEEVRAWGSHFDRRADEDTSLSRAAEGRPALRVTNAPAFSERSPAAIGTRSGSRKSTSAENTDSRPARRQVHLVHGLSGLYSTNSGKGSPVRDSGAKSGRVAVAFRRHQNKPRPQLRFSTTQEVSSSGLGSTQPPRVRTQHRAPPRRRPPLPAVRPAGPGGWRRPGRLHAPEAARTGPVSASRRSHVLMPRGGAGSTGKWPLTGFLAGESPNQIWGAMLTDFSGHKAVGIFLPSCGVGAFFLARC